MRGMHLIVRSRLRPFRRLPAREDAAFAHAVQCLPHAGLCPPMGVTRRPPLHAGLRCPPGVRALCSGPDR